MNQSIENYNSHNKYESWGGIRFYNQTWKSTSNMTLFIQEYQNEIVFDVTTYILNLPQQLEEQAITILKCYEDSRFLKWQIEQYKSGSERWLCIFWRSTESNLDVFEKTLK